jgi:hypothetical protein
MATHTIRTTDSVFDGVSEGVTDNDVIYINSGVRTKLTLQNCTGSAGNEITFINSGGIVHISDNVSIAFAIENCQHFILSGRGHSRKYGIKVTGYDPTGIRIHDTSEYFIVQNVEVGAGVDGSGIRLFTAASDAPAFIGHDCVFRDLYIHDTVDTALYLNHHSTQGIPGRPIDGMEIYHCVLTAIGSDGVQVRNGDNFIVRNNEIWNLGYDGTTGAGIVVGTETGNSEFYSNWIRDCVKGVFALQHEAGIQIHHNLIEDCNTTGGNLGRGIWISTEGNDIDITHNTIVDEGTIDYCIVCGSGSSDIDSGYTIIANNGTGAIAAQGFVSGDELRHLDVGSPNIGTPDRGWLDYN